MFFVHLHITLVMIFQYLGVYSCMFLLLLFYTQTIKNGNVNVNWNIGAVIW